MVDRCDNDSSGLRRLLDKVRGIVLFFIHPYSSVSGADAAVTTNKSELKLSLSHLGLCVARRSENKTAKPSKLHSIIKLGSRHSD